MALFYIGCIATTGLCFWTMRRGNMNFYRDFAITMAVTFGWLALAVSSIA